MVAEIADLNSKSHLLTSTATVASITNQTLDLFKSFFDNTFDYFFLFIPLFALYKFYHANFNRFDLFNRYSKLYFLLYEYYFQLLLTLKD